MSDLIRRSETETLPAFYESQVQNWPSAVREPKLDPRHYYLLLMRRKWLILAVALTVMVVSALEVYTTTPLYTARTRIQIDPESSNILPYDDPFQAPLYFLAAESYIKTQAEVLKSRALALRVVMKLNLESDPVFNAETSPGLLTELQMSALEMIKQLLVGGARAETSSPEDSAGHSRQEECADAFRGRIGVNQIRGTRLLEVSYTFHDPEFGARLLNHLTDEFIEFDFEKRFNATTRASEFLEKQLFDLQKKVEKSEERLLRYAEDNQILNIDERVNITVERLTGLNTRLTEVEAQLMSKAAEYDGLKDASVENFPQSLRNATIASLESRSFDLQQHLARLSPKFGPDWPEVVQVNEELKTVSEQLSGEKRDAIKRTHLEYQTLLNHRNRLQLAFNEQKERANQLFQDSIQYNILKRETETNKELYEGLLQRVKQAGISAGLKSNNLQVLDTARAPTFASYPSKRRGLVVGLVIGLMLGVALAFLMDSIDNTLKTPEDIEQSVGLPTLAVVPALGGQGLQSASWNNPAETEKSLVPYLFSASPQSALWESYRALRTSILLSHSGSPPQTILVTSALPGEGKTTTTLHTAMVLAQTGARTLVMDLDMRKPALARVMGLPRQRGMSNYLSGNSDLSSQIQPTEVPNLFALGSGPHPPNPAELIGSERMRTGLRLLKDYFKYIVIDSPPIMSVSDALVAANQVDGVVLVVHGGKTPRDAVQKATDRLLAVGAKLLGGMINNVDVRKTEYSYYYRYYYYYDDYSSESATRSAEVG